MPKVFATILLATVIFQAQAQTALPDFTIDNLGKNRVRIAWVNHFGDDLVQLSVQSSYDSIRNFRTIFSSPSPQLPENGFVDKRTAGGMLYYRIFYVLNGGAYYFTISKLAFTGMAGGTGQGYITVRDESSVIAQLSPEQFSRFRDSIVSQTSDSLFAINDHEVVVKYYRAVGGYAPSKFVVINSEGFAEIKLPQAKNKRYKIIFFDNDGTKLFTINKVNDTDLIMDKTNFMHAGWFSFELYENDRLLEKNRIYLQKDF